MTEQSTPRQLGQVLRQLGPEKAAIDTGRKRELILRVEQRKGYLPQVNRTLDQIKPALRSVIRKLTKGEIDWPLYLFGDVGVGKTCAALVLCDMAKSAWYMTADALVDTMVQTWHDDPVAFRRLEAIAAHPVAVLDELGTHQPKIVATNGDTATELHCKAVKDFYERRERVCQSGTIYVSNVEPEHLSQVYDDRIASRLLSGTHHWLKDKDRRQRT